MAYPHDRYFYYALTTTTTTTTKARKESGAKGGNFKRNYNLSKTQTQLVNHQPLQPIT